MGQLLRRCRDAATPTIVAPAKAKQLDPVCQELKDTHLVLRSPEGIVYYMGQILAMEQDQDNGKFCVGEKSPNDADIPGCIPRIFTGSRYPASPLFTIHKGEAGSVGFIVNISLDGEKYYIKQETGYNASMQFLTLAEQLIALQKKGTTLPTTPTVQLINP